MLPKRGQVPKKACRFPMLDDGLAYASSQGGGRAHYTAEWRRGGWYNGIRLYFTITHAAHPPLQWT